MSNTPVSRSERIIDQVLAEAGLEEADDLRPVLLELRTLTGDQPQPSPQVLALMSGTGLSGTSERTGDGTVIDLAARRRNKHRLPMTALGVAVALAAGGGAAAAADQGVRDTLHNAFSSIAATFGGSQGQEGPDRDGTDPGQPGGTFQGTSPTPALSTPGTIPGNGSPADSQPGKDQPNQPPADAGNGRPSGSQWLGRNTPSVPGTGQSTPSDLPVPEVTAPDLQIPSVPALPAPERSGDPEAQP